MMVGERIKRARLQIGMTPKDLAKAIKLRSVATITEYEKGRTVPSVNALMLLGQTLNVRPGWLLGETFDEQEASQPMPYSSMGIPSDTPQKAGHSRPFSEAAMVRSKERSLARGRSQLALAPKRAATPEKPSKPSKPSKPRKPSSP